MPADVAMHTNFLRLDSGSKSNSSSSSSSSSSSKAQSNVDSCWNTENMSGEMTVVGLNGHRRSVQVKVYRTSVEHFAVIYPLEDKMPRPIGVLNLRNTTIERLGDEGFVVSQRGCDDLMALTFLLERPEDIEYWITAFTARSSPLVHQSSLPIVEEEEI